MVAVGNIQFNLKKVNYGGVLVYWSKSVLWCFPLVLWCSGVKVYYGASHWCSGVKVDCALVTPHAQARARAPNETLSGNHHILSSRAREHCTPSKISRLLHGKLEGGELQVNSIVPLLTFGLFART